LYLSATDPLKATEAVAHAIFSWLKLELFRNPIRRLGAKLAIQVDSEKDQL
jgi:hypothetical protein